MVFVEGLDKMPCGMMMIAFGFKIMVIILSDYSQMRVDHLVGVSMHIMYILYMYNVHIRAHMSIEYSSYMYMVQVLLPCFCPKNTSWNSFSITT